MSVVLRIIGLIWVLLSIQKSWGIAQKFFHVGFQFNPSLSQLLYLCALGGGVGLLLLKDWGRYLLVIACIGLWILNVFPSLSRFNFNESFLRNTLFYGIFLTVLFLPASKKTTGD